MLASRDGSVWTGGKGALRRLHEGRVTCFRNGRELPGSQVTSLFEDHALRLWIGLDQGLWVYERGRFLEVTRRDGRPIGAVSGIAEDTDQQIWITAAGPPARSRASTACGCRDAEVKPPKPRRVAADPTGGLWWDSSTVTSHTFEMVRPQIHAFEHPGRRVALSVPVGSRRFGHCSHNIWVDRMAQREGAVPHRKERPAVRASTCDSFRRTSVTYGFS